MAVRQETYAQQTISLPAERRLAPKKNPMEQPQTTPPESRAEDQSRPPEEVIHELVEELERLLESGQWPEALERFSGLHPVDQGEVLDGLPREFRQSLLAELDHAVVADILEYLAPALEPASTDPPSTEAKTAFKNAESWTVSNRCSGLPPVK